MAASVLTKSESWVGGIFCALCSTGLASLSVMMLLDMPDAMPPLAVTWTVLILVSAAELWLLVMIVSRLTKGDHPVAVTVAVRQPRYWGPLRPIIGMFWLAHVIIPLYSSLILVTTERDTPGDGVANAIVAVLWCIGMAYAANTFLLLAAVAATGKERFARSLWEHRWAWDVGIGLTIATVRLLFGDVVG